MLASSLLPAASRLTPMFLDPEQRPMARRAPRPPPPWLTTHYVDPGRLGPSDACLLAVDASLRAQVLHSAFPCVAARSAFNRGGYRFGLLAPLGSQEATAQLWQALRHFGEEFPSPVDEFVTYVAVFQDAGSQGELPFETALWDQLQALHALDARHFGWAEGVGQDPRGDDFSFSVGGRAFFVVGMHPRASRLARRAPHTTVVFNLHEQFERLRTTGKYDAMQHAIRRRDQALQGSINPVLASFGESSEARQYSGRAVPADWRCPFQAVKS